ncbi:MAG: acyl-CoA synthetase [Rhodospirillaceae bacterium TMED8]|nr:acyl-CoA synthetase [Magnetovibrio sp.]OUT50188.1 MAG: acyl-CoA synthetase [Rhodospirillaceae bacterium TMED8]|tara:strand:+ start:1352 stop:2989 length:1638 start_codon:yes stop_codon:yes gene_type:complete
MTKNIYDQGLEKVRANFSPLSPISFIARTANTYPNHTSVIHGRKRFTWAETFQRSRQLAAALEGRGIGRGDTVAVMASNTPEMYECAFGPAMIGAVVNALNVRLDAEAIAFCLTHGEARVLLTDTEFAPTVKIAVEKLDRDDLIVIDIVDSEGDFTHCELIGETNYEAFIAEGYANLPFELPSDEWNAISLNYTSGTTGNPKGVVYHHRGAYLNALSNAVGWNMNHHATYLWTLPMFHCNGWCFPWTIAAVAGTNVCLRRVNAKNIFTAIAEHKVTHFCGAPIVLNLVINATDTERRKFDHQVKVMTAAAPPPATTLQQMQEQGFEVTHVYGLTETYGPAVICAWHPEWAELPINEQITKKGRQGVPYHVLEGLQVMKPGTMQPVPPDGETMGEVMFQGNVVMKGYLKNTETTSAALAGGWFHSGDLGVMHPDGYVQLKDRSKDIIISGGENISSIEVEDALSRHPAVMLSAVVAKPDKKWGETPCAFIEVKTGVDTPSKEDMLDFCRKNLAHYKCPKDIIFCELPKTSTGKVQKFKLRAQLLPD